MPRTPTTLLRAAVVLWLAVVGVGLTAVWSYASREARPADAPAQWPAASRLDRAPGQPTLVMLVHPRCACSRASLGELSRLMAHVYGKVTTHVAIYMPEGAPPEWEATDLRAMAETIPGVHVTTDAGAEMRAFGAAASGQVLLYDASGALAFSGGVTFARGHEGDNDGRSAIEALILDGGSPIRHTPVFGCLLRSAS